MRSIFHMKIGCTIKLDTFGCCETENGQLFYDAFGDLDGLLNYLGENVNSVELHTVYSDTNREVLKNAFLSCRKRGLSCTCHASFKGYSTPEQFFSPYEYILENGFAEKLNLTLHPQELYHKLEQTLRELCSYADEKNLPIILCLENQRIVKGNMTAGICRDVEEVVTRINSDRLKICFDFGHRKSNADVYGADADTVSENFISRVGHTHIHSLYNGKTHFPLHIGKTELEKNLIALFKSGFDGVLNIELSPMRYCDEFDVRESIAYSISVLKTAAAQAEAIIAAKEKFRNYTHHGEQVFEALEKEPHMIGAIAPAAYVLRLGDVKIAVDPSMCGLPDESENRAYLIRKLADFDAVIVTHGHSDHYDTALLQELGKKVKCYIPAFLCCENTMHFSAGDSIKVGELTISAYESSHNEAGMAPVPEYGLTLTYRGKTIAMPTDIRDYCTDHFRGMRADLLVGHLWLGRKNAMNLYDNAYIPAFCRCINGFDAKKVFIGHMDDARRKMDSIWTDVHFRAVEKEIPNAETLKFGEYKSLAFLGL